MSDTDDDVLKLAEAVVKFKEEVVIVFDSLSTTLGDQMTFNAAVNSSLSKLENVVIELCKKVENINKTINLEVTHKTVQ